MKRERRSLMLPTPTLTHCSTKRRWLACSSRCSVDHKADSARSILFTNGGTPALPAWMLKQERAARGKILPKCKKSAPLGANDMKKPWEPLALLKHDFDALKKWKSWKAATDDEEWRKVTYEHWDNGQNKVIRMTYPLNSARFCSLLEASSLFAKVIPGAAATI